MAHFRRTSASLLRLTCSGALVAGTALFSSEALAVEAEVRSTSAAQGYAITSPWGSITTTRQRFLETLSLGVYGIEGGTPAPGAPELSFKLSMRLSADAGIKKAETSYSPDADGFIPGLSATPVDLMYGYLEGRNLAGGWLGFRLGRQYVSDVLGWWSFDGALVRVTTPFYVQLEAYGGLEQRGGLPLSTGRYEQQGVWRGSRSGIPDNVYPQFQRASIAPAYGVALESAGPTWIHGRLDYRKVINTGDATTAQFVPDPVTLEYAKYSGSRTSSERIGYAMDASADKLGGVKAGIMYDLYNGFVGNGYAGVDVYAAPHVTFGADYDYYRPTFDGDSIFNFFEHNAMSTILGRVAVEPSNRVDFAISGGARRYSTTGDPAAPTDTPDTTTATAGADALANANARYRYNGGTAGVTAMVQSGDRGHREGGDVYAEQRWLGSRWMTQQRVSLYDWKDELRPDRSATSFGYVLGAGFRPSEAAQAMLQWEHNMNRIAGQRFRILAVLNIAVGK